MIPREPGEELFNKYEESWELSCCFKALSHGIVCFMYKWNKCLGQSIKILQKIQLLEREKLGCIGE